MNHVLTVDVEDWFQTNDFNFDMTTWSSFESRIERNTHRLLDLFDEYGVKGTFFTLGYVAQHAPRLVREIVERGHEIASHGMYHRLLTRLSRTEIEAEIVQSKALLEDVSGQSVTAFRAPSWSVSEDNLYVLELLEQHGYQVDSSLQPFRTPLSGMRRVPRAPFHPVVGGRALSLLEVPSCTVSVLGTALPFSGGLYLRVLPASLIAWCLQRVGKQRPGMIYTHPWELDVHQPRLDVPWLIQQVHYFHLHTTERKLRNLLARFNFGTMTNIMACQEYPEISL